VVTRHSPRRRVDGIEAGAKFTLDEARQALLNYNVVHFATRELLDEDTPLFSALFVG